MNHKLAAFVLGILFIPVAASAQFRKYSNEFLNIGAGARGLAMGSAQVASVSDGTSGYWNPAGLAAVKDHPQLNFMHAQYFAGIGSYQYASAAIPIQDNKRTLGVSFLRFAVDDIPNTLFLIAPDGTINYGNVTSFSSADYALLLSFAQTIKEVDDKRWSFGVNAKVIRRVVGKFAGAWGFGLDAGVQMHSNSWQFGIVAKDITTTFNAWSFNFTDKEKEILYLTKNEIPVKSTELTAPRIVVGGGYNFTISEKVKLLAEANLNLTFDGKRNTLLKSSVLSADPSVGLEANVNDVFYVRGGVTNFQQALADGDTLNQKKVWVYQPSLGAGFKFKGVSLDYAFSNLANQSNPLYTHVFSLRLDLVKKEK